ncbi:MAG TPA: Hsp20/alpha crystallin family protein [Candidatus Hydrogenedentes bacterium]|nr:Hsp20/alpha crystallin family protein [Candidatus Hydrogenedentota bacterium]HPG66047.1 Hsp20/alpha crystallin family protein [Candidatus Hydrogenedentota bacterium]
MTWNLFDEVDALRREVERAFEMHTPDRWRLPFSRVSFLPGLAARAYPLLNVSEDKDNVYIEALAPGVDPESLDITVQQGVVRIAGEKKPISEDVKMEAFHRNERSAGKFVRTVALQADVNPDKVTAHYENGLLLITLPRVEAAKPKQITVNVG